MIAIPLFDILVWALPNEELTGSEVESKEGEIFLAVISIAEDFASIPRINSMKQH